MNAKSNNTSHTSTAIKTVIGIAVAVLLVVAAWLLSGVLAKQTSALAFVAILTGGVVVTVVVAAVVVMVVVPRSKDGTQRCESESLPAEQVDKAFSEALRNRPLTPKTERSLVGATV